MRTMNVPDFEADNTEDDGIGNNRLDTEGAARDIEMYLWQNFDGVDRHSVTVTDRRPQHEAQRAGSVSFSVKISQEQPFDRVIDVLQFANEIDAENFSLRQVSIGDNKGDYSITFTKWQTSFPVYSDYFGMVTTF